MSRFRTLSFTVLLAAGLVAPLSASALTVEELTAQISALMQQVTMLQSRFNTQSDTVPATTDQPPAQEAPSTGAAVSAPTGNNCPSFTRPLSRGMKGEDVLSLQGILFEAGLLTRDQVIGLFGPRTEAALQEWQAKYDIVSSGSPSSTGWGVLGPRTMQFITLNCASRAASVNASDTAQDGSCPVAQRPVSSCAGTWQAIEDDNGCTNAWRCSVNIPDGTAAPGQGTGSPIECASAPRPTSECGGTWSALTDTNGCTVAWQCALPLQ